MYNTRVYSCVYCPTYTPVDTQMCVRVYAHTRVYTRVCVRMHVNVRMHIGSQAGTHGLWLYARTCVRRPTHASHTNTRMNFHTHTHVHTCGMDSRKNTHMHVQLCTGTHANPLACTLARTPARRNTSAPLCMTLADEQIA